MPRLRLYKPEKGADYYYIDRAVREQFDIGGTDVLVHKYIGPKKSDKDGNPIPTDELTIQDVLFLENRDRKYDQDIYQLSGVYNVSDSDFDLSQFGLFLQTGTLFMTFHTNDMIDIMGRKIMNGDVLELMHLIDYNPLDETLPVALKRFYVASDCQRASEGFSPTWWSHMWRVRLNPLTDSQEYKDILNTITVGANATPISSVLSSIDKYQHINDAIITQAEVEVPKSGYDTSGIYIKSNVFPDEDAVTPQDKVHGYLTGDGVGPNGLAVASGITFPVEIGRAHV